MRTKLFLTCWSGRFFILPRITTEKIDCWKYPAQTVGVFWLTLRLTIYHT